MPRLLGKETSGPTGRFVLRHWLEAFPSAVGVMIKSNQVVGTLASLSHSLCVLHDPCHCVPHTSPHSTAPPNSAASLHRVLLHSRSRIRWPVYLSVPPRSAAPTFVLLAFPSCFRHPVPSPRARKLTQRRSECTIPQDLLPGTSPHSLASNGDGARHPPLRHTAIMSTASTGKPPCQLRVR
jgi:hypothetical protein